MSEGSVPWSRRDTSIHSGRPRRRASAVASTESFSSEQRYAIAFRRPQQARLKRNALEEAAQSLRHQASKRCPTEIPPVAARVVRACLGPRLPQSGEKPGRGRGGPGATAVLRRFTVAGEYFSPSVLTWSNGAMACADRSVRTSFFLPDYLGVPPPLLPMRTPYRPAWERGLSIRGPRHPRRTRPHFPRVQRADCAFGCRGGFLETPEL